MSLDETLAAIDTATGCQWCGGPLNGSVSADFCREEHQVAWHHAHVGQSWRGPSLSAFRSGYVPGTAAWKMNVMLALQSVIDCYAHRDGTAPVPPALATEIGHNYRRTLEMCRSPESS